MVFIDNVSPRFDVHRVAMDIHDGGLFEYGGRYFYYGMGYQNCSLENSFMPPRNCPGIYERMGEGCGFRIDHTLPVYSSSDLVRWTYEGDALPKSMRPYGIYFRPKIIFDPRTSEFVLWINYLRQQGPNWPRNTPLQSYISNISIVVAKAASPQGPFKVVNPWAQLQVTGVGDFALIVTTEGTNSSTFIAYDAWDNGHRVRIEKLNPTWTSSLPDAAATTGDLSEADVEAPMLFERKGWYYLIYGTTCCFCSEGGNAVVQTARHPLGPWTRSGIDLNPWGVHPGGCGRNVPSQNNYVAKVPTTNGSVEYIFMADLWTTAPDGLKSHDVQFWAPLRFDDAKSPPTILPLEWNPGFEIDVKGAALGATAPVVEGPLGPGSALKKIRKNQMLCTRSNNFEPHVLLAICVLVLMVGFACCSCCWRICRRKRRAGSNVDAEPLLH
eukprot:TRINITY_DN17031_c0_g1_i1.p1 TRINITY_DN17031_c0_g1~~TRINITY_DN17031_c0_g1_i1.p1  ORF type:complete len:440 (+),score=64.77 TRINITY_DN17031_c0_g1_i1:26-1345(+)